MRVIDTHGQKGKETIAVDLDGTLASYDGWKGIHHIGDPIPKMVERVKRWIDDGMNVVIFTARVDENPEAPDDAHNARMYIKLWLDKHIGRSLPITNIKTKMMTQLWDDRCVQVEPNTGERVDGKE